MCEASIGTEKSAVTAAPAPSKIIWVLGGLFVISNTTVNVAHPRNEAYLRYRLCVGTRPHEHVADFSDLSFWLLSRGIEFLQQQSPRRPEWLPGAAFDFCFQRFHLVIQCCRGVCAKVFAGFGSASLISSASVFATIQPWTVSTLPKR